MKKLPIWLSCFFILLLAPGFVFGPGTQDYQFGITVGDGINVISTGSKGYARIPRNMVITGWWLAADVSGSIVVDTYKTDAGSYPPSVSMWTTKPSLSSSITNSSNGLSIAVKKGDWVGYNVDSASTVTRVCLCIYGQAQ